MPGRWEVFCREGGKFFVVKVGSFLPGRWEVFYREGGKFFAGKAGSFLPGRREVIVNLKAVRHKKKPPFMRGFVL